MFIVGPFRRAGVCRVAKFALWPCRSEYMAAADRRVAAAVTAIAVPNTAAVRNPPASRKPSAVAASADSHDDVLSDAYALVASAHNRSAILRTCLARWRHHPNGLVQRRVDRVRRLAATADAYYAMKLQSACCAAWRWRLAQRTLRAQQSNVARKHFAGITTRRVVAAWQVAARVLAARRRHRAVVMHGQRFAALEQGSLAATGRRAFRKWLLRGVRTLCVRVLRTATTKRLAARHCGLWLRWTQQRCRQQLALRAVAMHPGAAANSLRAAWHTWMVAAATSGSVRLGRLAALERAHRDHVAPRRVREECFTAWRLAVRRRTLTRHRCRVVVTCAFRSWHRHVQRARVVACGLARIRSAAGTALAARSFLLLREAAHGRATWRRALGHHTRQTLRKVVREWRRYSRAVEAQRAVVALSPESRIGLEAVVGPLSVLRSGVRHVGAPLPLPLPAFPSSRHVDEATQTPPPHNLCEPPTAARSVPPAAPLCVDAGLGADESHACKHAPRSPTSSGVMPSPQTPAAAGALPSRTLQASPSPHRPQLWATPRALPTPPPIFDESPYGVTARRWAPSATPVAAAPQPTASEPTKAAKAAQLVRLLDAYDALRRHESRDDQLIAAALDSADLGGSASVDTRELARALERSRMRDTLKIQVSGLRHALTAARATPQPRDAVPSRHADPFAMLASPSPTTASHWRAAYQATTA